ncbi:MAG: hypothetical protein AB2733_13035 [Candidatus Thiodiazotropha taylori]
MKRIFTLLVLVGFLFFSVACVSSEITQKEILTKENESIMAKCKDEGCNEKDFEKLKVNTSALDKLTETFDFGIAIGFEHYKNGYVNNAETLGDERIVRISDSQDYKPSIWLETHYIWDGIGKNWFGRTHSAPGFYVAAQLLGPESEIFQAFSLGAMWSFKRTAIGNSPPPGQIAKSINIGIGPVWHKTKTLASGITEGEALPAEYNDVKLDSKDEVSWMIMISAGF